MGSIHEIKEKPKNRINKYRGCSVFASIVEDGHWSMAQCCRLMYVATNLCQLLVGTVPDKRHLLAGTVPEKRHLLAGTVPDKRYLLVGAFPDKRHLLVGAVPD